MPSQTLTRQSTRKSQGGLNFKGFLGLLTGYLKSNQTLLKKDLESLFPETPKGSLKALTQQAIASGKIVQHPAGFRGPWVLQLGSRHGSGKAVPTQTKAQASKNKTGKATGRRNLSVKLPPQVVKYLRHHGTISLSRFRKEFGVTNAPRAKTLLQQMVGQGMLKIVPGPRPTFTLANGGTPGTTMQVVTTGRKPRSKSQKYYDLRQTIPTLIKRHPHGMRFLEIADHFKLHRNDATLISVLKDLVANQVLLREEGKDGTGRKVSYKLMTQSQTVPTGEGVDERDATINFLLTKYDELLGQVERLQVELSRKRAQAPAEIEHALPPNLKNRLRQLQQRDQQVSRQLVLK